MSSEPGDAFPEGSLSLLVTDTWSLPFPPKPTQISLDCFVEKFVNAFIADLAILISQQALHAELTFVLLVQVASVWLRVYGTRLP